MSEYSIIGKPTPNVTARRRSRGGTVHHRYDPAAHAVRQTPPEPVPTPDPQHRHQRGGKTAGVKAVITGKDTPGAMGPLAALPRASDQQALATDKVRFIGDPVAAVAATTEIAEALDLIEVDYEPLPAVFDPIEAIKDDAPMVHEFPSNINATPHRMGRRGCRLRQGRLHPEDRFVLEAATPAQWKYTIPGQRQGHRPPDRGLDRSPTSSAEPGGC